MWTRYFGDAILRTVQWMSGDLLVEAIGPVRVYYHVLASEAGMCFNSARARCWGVPLPLRIQAVVRGGDSSWEFEVDVAGIGSYRGVMNLLP